MAANAWQDEHLNFALDRWAEGFSASNIANQLGARFGFLTTRNAVIGQINRHAPAEIRRSKYVNRLNQGHNSRRNGKKARPPRPKPKKQLSPLDILRLAGTPLPPRQETDIARVSFTDLENGKHCKFIPETNQPFKMDAPHYCGLPPVPGLPYCPVHAQRCYRPVAPHVPNFGQPVHPNFGGGARIKAKVFA